MKRAPAHAGRLRGPERLAFALVFVLMAAFVVGLAMTASRAGAHALTGSPVAAGSRTVKAGTTGSPDGQNAAAGGVERAGQADGAETVSPKRSQPALDAALDAALRPVARRYPGQFSVGIIDQSTGAEALYRAGRRYPGAGVLTADILAALLYQHQVAATQLTAGDDNQAADMLEKGSAAAAGRLWTAIGGGRGLAAANLVLRLTRTSPVPGGRWWLSRTTVTDQLQLLTDLTAGHSVLGSAARDYELGLLADVTAAQRWGVPAAASGDPGYAVSDGWLSGPRVADSVGVVRHDGQALLIVVLSAGSQSRAGAIGLVRSAALAAAFAVTRAAS